MNNFKFFNVNRIYNELFYQFPKVLIASDKYKKMSDSTKIAYMLLKARLEFAVQRNQVDENGNVYFTFTISELGEVLDCGKQKVLAIKSQLEEYGLLYQKQMGFNKTLGKNNPNRLYLAELEVTENDIYQLQTFDDTMQENVDKSEGMKISTVFNNLNTDTLDTLDTEKDRLQQQLLLDQFSEVQENTFLNKDSLKFIAAFANTIQEAHEQVGTIIRAKTKVEKEYNIVLIGENYQAEIDKCLRRVMHKIKTDSTVKSPKGLFYMSFYNLFVECALEKKSQLSKKNNSDTPGVITHNWVENQ
ncbi:replication initiator protein A [Enterococcus faecalis]|uniref:replication initiator protein A n=1 Tax=Enterococcus faecalis TaxID=1351 RepID=UPI002DB7A7A3|nr:replication initiator protein A [Enterococcus faecalis]MEB7954648.1 replication initiator protein A [Enterococcus faecalis]MEB7964812.1 replication initiator protein A [Enterococcus faecalis]